MGTDKQKITIRNASPTDQDFLFTMLYQSIFVPPGTAPPGPDIVNEPSIRQYVEEWGRPGDFALIASDADGVPVGAVWLRYFSAEKPGYGYVDDTCPEMGIAVDTPHRGQGIGTRLLDALFALINPETERISLSVDKENPAVSLYRRFGFQTLSESEGSLTMVWRATAPGTGQAGN